MVVIVSLAMVLDCFPAPDGRKSLIPADLSGQYKSPPILLFAHVLVGEPGSTSPEHAPRQLPPARRAGNAIPSARTIRAKMKVSNAAMMSHRPITAQCVRIPTSGRTKPLAT